jgi:hypothetical protein
MHRIPGHPSAVAAHARTHLRWIRVLALLASGRQTSYWIFEHSDLTLGEIQTALVRLHDANLVVREVGHGRKQVFWSRAPGTLSPDTP